MRRAAQTYLPLKGGGRRAKRAGGGAILPPPCPPPPPSPFQGEGERRSNGATWAAVSASLRLQSRGLHDRADALEFAADEFAERGRRHVRHIGRHGGELAAEIRQAERREHVAPQLVDDRL